MNSVGSTYDFPIIEEFLPITVNFNTFLSAFIKFAYPTFTFTPTKKTDEGEFLI
jgi:hypothetical protein